MSYDQKLPETIQRRGLAASPCRSVVSRVRFRGQSRPSFNQPQCPFLTKHGRRLCSVSGTSLKFSTGRQFRRQRPSVARIVPLRQAELLAPSSVGFSWHIGITSLIAELLFRS